MKAIAYLVALLVAGAGWLGAQDTAHPPAPPTPPPPPPAPAVAPAPPAAPAASLTVAEAAVAKTVVDRAPQDTGTAFTPDVGQLICWTKVTGASGDATIHQTPKWGTSSFTSAARRGARGAARRSRPMGQARGTWRSETRPGRY